MIGPLDRAGEFSAMLFPVDDSDVSPQNALKGPKIFPTQEFSATTDKAEIERSAKPKTMKRIKDRFFDISATPFISYRNKLWYLPLIKVADTKILSFVTLARFRNEPFITNETNSGKGAQTRILHL